MSSPDRDPTHPAPTGDAPSTVAGGPRAPDQAVASPRSATRRIAGGPADHSNADPAHGPPDPEAITAPVGDAARPASSGDLSAVMAGLQAFKDVDPEESIEIPPPSRLPTTSDAPPGDPYIGTTFDHRYKIESKLGEGGMGVVYLARHKVIDKRVAVKVLRADMAKDKEVLDRFVQEARAASSIGNPHIVDISDFGELPDGSTYFVMEYLEGTPLSQLSENGTLVTDVDRACRIAAQLAEGLAGAHAREIVHRDLKPENVFLVPRGNDKDFVKILDFGIAKVSNAGITKLTRAGTVFGTPHYMSPEQAAGAPIDHRADIYALGVILYELVAGALPFTADNFMGILTQHMYKAPVPIRALVSAPDCPPGVEAIVLKCLSKKPEARYQSMEELAQDLERYLAGDVPQAVSEMMARSAGFNVPHDYFKSHAQKAIVPATPMGRRSPWPRYVWIAGALAAIGLVTVILVQGNDTTAQPVAEGARGAAAVPPAPKEKEGVNVAVAANPETASAWVDGKQVTLPTTVFVEQGQSIEVEIKADGFVSKTVELDGTEPSKLVRLDPEPGTEPSAIANPPAGARPNPPPATGARPPSHTPIKKKKSSEVVEPWE
jgi:tRNA A-37 threonylcarbamoyl transferase component Bud32